MRRVISIAMAIEGLIMLLTGIWKLFPPIDPITFVPHIVNSFAFGVLVITYPCMVKSEADFSVL